MTTYKDAGVDVAAGDEAVKGIYDLVKSTWRGGPAMVLPDVGFLGNVVVYRDGIAETIKTDSAGSKTVIASLMDVHTTIGIDAAAMVANDLAAGACWPEYGINCLLMGKQLPQRTHDIVQGYVRGCVEAGCMLVNGEMAELPGVLAPNHYEVVAAMKGKALAMDLVTGEDIRPGMGVFGIPSSGVHSNGYSLIRKVFRLGEEDSTQMRATLAWKYEDLNQTFGEELLTPTRIYVHEAKRLVKAAPIAGFVHVTGGGMIGKIPRILPRGCGVRLKTWEFPPIFKIIAAAGCVSDDEMLRTFNCGYGFLAISQEDLTGYGLCHLGEVVEDEERRVVIA